MRLAGLTELQARLQREHRPWSASLEVTRRCNLRCVHCLRGPSVQDDGLSYDEVCRLVDQLADLGCMRLSLTGGEPLARPDILSIVDYAWQRRMALTILTNGTLVTAVLADALADLHVHEIQVSLYAASSGVHDGITRTLGSFLATVKGIERLAGRGLRVRVMMPVLRLNVQEVGAVRALCDQMGVGFERSLLLFPGDHGSREPLAFLATDEQLCCLAAEEAAMDCSALGANGMAVVAEARPLCTAGSQQLGIGPDGSVYPCGALRLPVGNIRYQELASIWRTSPLLQELRDTGPSFPSACATCQARQSCFWCPGLSLAMAGDMAVPNGQDCRRTRIFHGGVDSGGIRVQSTRRIS